MDIPIYIIIRFALLEFVHKQADLRCNEVGFVFKNVILGLTCSSIAIFLLASCWYSKYSNHAMNSVYPKSKSVCQTPPQSDLLLVSLFTFRKWGESACLAEKREF